MNLVSESGDARRLAAVFATITLVLLALLAVAARADAAEAVYWNNYENGSLSFSNLDGSGGGPLNTAGVDIDSPEGMAYDTVTNRIYLANESGGTGNGEIVFINLDGSGAGVFSAPGVPVDTPEGIAIDPATRTIYWINNGIPSIAWAKLDGSGGGVLNTAGATLDPSNRIAFDPLTRRVYWTNGLGGADNIGFANVDNSGGGDINLNVPVPPENLTGIAMDPAGGRVFWLENQDDRIGFQPLDGSAGGDLDLTGAVLDSPYGLAIDPALGRVYWANYGVAKDPTAALGFVGLGGGAGNISPTTAPVDGPQDPLILKSPAGTAVPSLTRNPKVRNEMTCSQGTWAADLPGAFVYQAPRSFSYQWTLDGAAIPGATAATFTATAPGTYGCTVTATNHIGSAAQQSAAVPVTASKLMLKTKRKAKADPGDRVTFKLKIVNRGDLQSKKARLCVKLPKAARDDLRKPKCKKLGPLASLAKRNAKFRIKVKPGADKGTGKLTFQVKGTPGKAAKSKIVVR